MHTNYLVSNYETSMPTMSVVRENQHWAGVYCIDPATSAELIKFGDGKLAHFKFKFTETKWNCQNGKQKSVHYDFVMLAETFRLQMT